MIRILTVDDEELILNTTCNYVEQHFDAEVFRANSGFEALELLRRMRFDVVITDVSMPLMDGIELMRNVKHVWPQCYVIILTVFDRFDYAYEATKYNQVDYVLKSDGMQALHASLQRAIEWIESELRKERMLSRLGQQIESMKPQLQAETVRRLLRHSSELPTRDELHAIGLEIDPDRAVLPVLCALDAAHQSQTAAYLPGIAEALRRHLAGRGLRVELIQLGGEILGLIQQEREPREGDAQVFVSDALERCIESMNLNDGPRLAAAVGEAFVPLRSLPLAYDQMAYHLEGLRNTAALKVVVSAESSPGRHYDCIGPESIELLWQYIRAEDAGQFRKTLSDLLSPLEEIRHMDALQPFAEAYALSYLHLKASRIMEPDLQTSEATTQMLALSGTDISGREWIGAVLQCFDRLFTRREEIGTDNAGRLISRINEYIRRHYSEDIHLSTIAEVFHYSPSYLSRLYKEHTGENLSGAINSARIGIAQTLLTSTALSVNEIGHRCGFYSNKYFMQVFKRETGLTPSQFRQNS